MFEHFRIFSTTERSKAHCVYVRIGIHFSLCQTFHYKQKNSNTVLNLATFFETSASFEFPLNFNYEPKRLIEM